MDHSSTILEHRVAFQGRVFRVHTDRVRLPNGATVDLDVVRHGGSVILVPLPDPAHVVLVRQYRYAIDRWIWELPAGRVEPHETAEDAARRECEEEVGLVAGHLERLGAFYPSPGFCDEIMMVYRLSDLSPPPAGAPPVRRDADEDLQVRTFAIDEVGRMIADGQILDMKTTVGLNLIQQAARNSG